MNGNRDSDGERSRRARPARLGRERSTIRGLRGRGGVRTLLSIMLSDEIPLKRRSRAGGAGVRPVWEVAATAAPGTAPATVMGASQAVAPARPDPSPIRFDQGRRAARPASGRHATTSSCAAASSQHPTLLADSSGDRIHEKLLERWRADSWRTKMKWRRSWLTSLTAFWNERPEFIGVTPTSISGGLVNAGAQPMRRSGGIAGKFRSTAEKSRPSEQGA